MTSSQTDHTNHIPRSPMQSAPNNTHLSAQQCLELVLQALDDMKAKNTLVIDVDDLTILMSHIVIAEGTSTRHLAAVAENVAKQAKQHGLMPLGTEGGEASDWVLIDLGDVVVHLMMPEARKFYDLEGLWQNVTTDKTQSQSMQAHLLG